MHERPGVSTLAGGARVAQTAAGKPNGARSPALSSGAWLRPPVAGAAGTVRPELLAKVPSDVAPSTNKSTVGPIEAELAWALLGGEGAVVTPPKIGGEPEMTGTEGVVSAAGQPEARCPASPQVEQMTSRVAAAWHMYAMCPSSPQPQQGTLGQSLNQWGPPHS